MWDSWERSVCYWMSKPIQKIIIKKNKKSSIKWKTISTLSTSSKVDHSIVYLIMRHKLNPSSGKLFLTELLATPLTKVGNQSLTWHSSLFVVPLTDNGRRGLVTKATPRTPPSQRVDFSPRRGQFIPPERGRPPLSPDWKRENNTISS